MKITKSMIKDGVTSIDEAFDDFFSSLRPSLKLWDYFVDWDKVFRNTKKMEIDLNIWNYLLGKPDFENEFRLLLKQHPEIVSVIPVLIVRDGAGNQKFSLIEDVSNITNDDQIFDFTEPANSDESIELALQFVQKSGLINLFAKDGVKNLVDYVIGVEAGLNSNGRKNRSGKTMETVVEAYLEKFAKTCNVSFISQATPAKIRNTWDFDVPVDKSSRSFDFAISNGERLVLMEVNFYGGGGTKLKATAGEYKGLFNLLDLPNIDFVWITDGEGWKTARLPLKSAHDHINYVWNLNWLNKGYLADLFN